MAVFTVTNSTHGIGPARSAASRSSPEAKITGTPTRPHEYPTTSVSVTAMPFSRKSVPRVNVCDAKPPLPVLACIPTTATRVVPARLHQIDIRVEDLIATDQPGTLVELVEEQVRLGVPTPMPVNDVHLIGTTIEETGDDRIHVTREVGPPDGVPLRVTEAKRVRVGLAREPLHVVIHQDTRYTVRVSGRVFQRSRLAHEAESFSGLGVHRRRPRSRSR